MTLPASSARPLVVLVGPPGAGKSTVGGLLAESLGASFRDTDDDVAARAGRSVAEIFVEDGEPAFRALEHAAVDAALREHAGVLAVGGGAVLHPDTRGALAGYREAGGRVVFLDVTLAAAAGRVGFNQPRPVLLGNPRAQWQTLMAERRPVYQEVASDTVLTDRLTPDQVTAEVATVLAALAPAPQDEDGSGNDD